MRAPSALEEWSAATGAARRERAIGELWHHPLTMALAAAVPLRLRDYQLQGGPQPRDWARAGAFMDGLCEHGDVLLYGGGKRGQVAALFAQLVDAVAILAFCPGGITLCASHWEAAAP